MNILRKCEHCGKGELCITTENGTALCEEHYLEYLKNQEAAIKRSIRTLTARLKESK